MKAQQISISKTYISSPNIALVKYWGKYDEQNILPWNDSIGLTLNQRDLNTITTITFAKLPQSSLLLNNTKYPISKRIKSMLNMVKNIAKQRKYPQLNLQQWDQYNFKIQSTNSFPTASGMASSASGLACLAAALNGLFDNCFKQKQVSQLARRGSGSASRSVFGGLVRWYGVPEPYIQIKKPSEQQLKQLNEICTSQTIFPSQKLDNIRIFLFLANWHEKDVSSTSGMETSMKTSQLIWHRNKIARNRSDQILQLLTEMSQTQIKQQQYACFSKIAELVIKDSNQFHAICLDTYPPIHYLNSFSKQIMHIVDHILNPKLPSKIAYTFDAGPHAFLFLHKDFQQTIISYFNELFSLKQEHYNEQAKKIEKLDISKNNFEKYKGQIIKPHAVWATSVGGGAHQYKI